MGLLLLSVIKSNNTLFKEAIFANHCFKCSYVFEDYISEILKTATDFWFHDQTKFA